MQTNSNRKIYLDIIRLIALLYMFFQHSALAFLETSGLRGIIGFLYQLVPICAGMFLFASGYSISLVYKSGRHRSTGKLFMHLVKRAVILIAGGAILFLAEYGFQLPDLLAASNIINTIGYLLIISGLILFIPRKKITLTILILVLLLANYILEKLNIFIVPFNNGFEPLSPTIIFGFTGLLAGLITEELPGRFKIMFTAGLALSGFAVFMFFNYKYGLFRIFYEDTGRLGLSRIFNAGYEIPNLFIKNFKTDFFFVYLWNYKTSCFAATTGFIFFIYGILYFAEGILKKIIPRLVLLPGEFALINYFYHLIVIGILVLFFGFNSIPVPWFLVILVLITTSSYALSLGAYRLKKITRASSRRYSQDP